MLDDRRQRGQGVARARSLRERARRDVVCHDCIVVVIVFVARSRRKRALVRTTECLLLERPGGIPAHCQHVALGEQARVLEQARADLIFRFSPAGVCGGRAARVGQRAALVRRPMRVHPAAGHINEAGGVGKVRGMQPQAAVTVRVAHCRHAGAARRVCRRSRGRVVEHNLLRVLGTDVEGARCARAAEDRPGAPLHLASGLKLLL